jgi:hypothetical protein
MSMSVFVCCSGTDVVTLTDSNFEELVASKPDLWFVEVRKWMQQGLHVAQPHRHDQRGETAQSRVRQG